MSRNTNFRLSESRGLPFGHSVTSHNDLGLTSKLLNKFIEPYPSPSPGFVVASLPLPVLYPIRAELDVLPLLQTCWCPYLHLGLGKRTLVDARDYAEVEDLGTWREYELPIKPNLT